jgi:chromosome segregation ATPase
MTADLRRQLAAIRGKIVQKRKQALALAAEIESLERYAAHYEQKLAELGQDP